MSNDVDIFLEHFGVKGQRWGVRKQRKSKAKYKGIQEQYREQQLSKVARKKPREERTPEEQKALRNRRLEIGFTIATSGVLAAGFILKVHNNRKIAKLIKEGSPQIKAGKNAADAILSVSGEELVGVTRVTFGQ